MAEPAPMPVPGWLGRSGAVGWRILAVVGVAVVAGLVVARLPVSATATLVSLVLAAALAPTALRLRAAGRSRTVAAAITFGAAAILIVGVTVLLLVLLVPDLRAVGQRSSWGSRASGTDWRRWGRRRTRRSSSTSSRRPSRRASRRIPAPSLERSSPWAR